MPSVRTMVTEIVTGLATLGYQDVARALEVRPRHITHVDEGVFAALEAAWASGEHGAEFATAWENGVAFARSPLGLRGRPPWSLEWKGHHRPASKAIETIPADLRIDHVFLISCKYGSRILHNVSPVALFDDQLEPVRRTGSTDWFEHVAPDAYRAVWEPVLADIGTLPSTVPPSAATPRQRELVRRRLRSDPIDTDTPEYRALVVEVSERTASVWRAGLAGGSALAQLYWRLLRMQAAPYFVLGARHDGSPLRYMVETPWDFQQRFTVDDVEIGAGDRGQPSVDWRVAVGDLAVGVTHEVRGHVEVRWSHGKLNGAPEAKVHLDTDPTAVPGYEPI